MYIHTCTCYMYIHCTYIHTCICISHHTFLIVVFCDNIVHGQFMYTSVGAVIVRNALCTYKAWKKVQYDIYDAIRESNILSSCIIIIHV